MSDAIFRPVIHSLLETDLYKFTMWQALLHRFPTNQSEYRFICRNQPAFALASLIDEVQEQLDWLCGLRFQPDQAEDAALGYVHREGVQRNDAAKADRQIAYGKNGVHRCARLVRTTSPSNSMMQKQPCSSVMVLTLWKA